MDNNYNNGYNNQQDNNQMPNNQNDMPNYQEQYNQMYGQQNEQQNAQPQYNQQYGQQNNQPQYNQQPYGQQYAQPYNYNPEYQQPVNEDGKSMAVASLVLGIVSFFCCGTICSILGLIFGIISKKRQPENNGMATAGIVLSIITLVIGLIFLILYFSGIFTLYNYGYYYY